jgi:hypothetical protein
MSTLISMNSWLIKQARRRIRPSPIESLVMGIGRGLLAGLAGTAAISLSQALEMKLTKREPSTAPADAAGKVVGVRPRHLAGRARFAHIVHWAYGTSWGLFRALLGGRRSGRFWAGLAHLAAVQTAALLMLPRLGVAPPIKEWEPVEIGQELLHHAVYSAAADATYRALA